MEGATAPEEIQNNQTAIQITCILDDLMRDLESESRTAKLWIQYLIQTQIMRLFIFAERTGDFGLHLYCVQKMIPIFQAALHFPYAKSTRRYLDTMRELPSIMPETNTKLTQKKDITPFAEVTVSGQVFSLIRRLSKSSCTHRKLQGVWLGAEG